MEKRKVYNGYAEHYMTGSEIKAFFKGCYRYFGPSDNFLSGYQMDFDKYYKRLKADTTYRLFINDMHCKILDGETDADLYYFSYTRERPKWAKD